MLYLITLLTAPWLMRRGQHIRVDVLLRAVPKRLGWVLEWLVDALAHGLLRGHRATTARARRWASCRPGRCSIKTLVTPEWWLLAPLPLALFALLASRCCSACGASGCAPRAPRDDAVSTG